MAIELAPEAREPRLGLAEAYVRSGRPEEARRVLEDLLQLFPGFREADVLLERLKEKDTP